MGSRSVQKVHKEDSDDQYLSQWIIPCFMFGFIAGGLASTMAVFYELLRNEPFEMEKPVDEVATEPVDFTDATDITSSDTPSGMSIEVHTMNSQSEKTESDPHALPFCDILGPTTMDNTLISSSCIDQKSDVYVHQCDHTDPYRKFINTVRSVIITNFKQKMQTKSI